MQNLMLCSLTALKKLYIFLCTDNEYFYGSNNKQFHESFNLNTFIKEKTAFLTKPPPQKNTYITGFFIISLSVIYLKQTFIDR